MPQQMKDPMAWKQLLGGAAGAALGNRLGPLGAMIGGNIGSQVSPEAGLNPMTWFKAGGGMIPEGYMGGGPIAPQYHRLGGIALAKKKLRPKPDGWTGASKPHPTMQGSRKVQHKEDGGWIKSLFGLDSIENIINNKRAAQAALAQDAGVDNMGKAAAFAALQNELGQGPLSGALQAAAPQAPAVQAPALLHQPIDSQGNPASAGNPLPKNQQLLMAPLQFNTGGSVMAPSGTQSFMMEHDKGFKESAGPLAKTVYKNKGGEVWERAYHNPLAPAGGGGNKEA